LSSSCIGVPGCTRTCKHVPCAAGTRRENLEARQVPGQPRSNSNLPYTSFAKSLFANAIPIDQHTFYSPGSLHEEMQTFASNAAAAQRLLLIVNAGDTRCLLNCTVCPPRRNLQINNLPQSPPPANKECSEASTHAEHRHRHRDPSGRVQRMTCMGSGASPPAPSPPPGD